MMTDTTTLERSLAILIDELVGDDELRDAFFRHPHRTLRQAGEWALPLTVSEVVALTAPGVRVMDRVASALGARLGLAA
jgi:hypothetical protein